MTVLGEAAVAALHAELLAAQRAKDPAAVAEAMRKLREGPQFTARVRRARVLAQTQSGDRGAGRRVTTAELGQRSRRKLFVSLELLETHWRLKRLRSAELEDALLVCSDRYRSAVHGPPPDNKVRMRRTAPREGPALELANELREALLAKEAAGEVFWLGQSPGRTFEDLSRWISKMSDPGTGTRYPALQLSATWWRKRFPPSGYVPRFTRSGEKVARNFLGNGSEPSSLLELLAFSHGEVIKLVTR